MIHSTFGTKSILRSEGKYTPRMTLDNLLVTDLVPSEIACFASSPGRMREINYARYIYDRRSLSLRCTLISLSYQLKTRISKILPTRLAVNGTFRYRSMTNLKYTLGYWKSWTMIWTIQAIV